MENLNIHPEVIELYEELVRVRREIHMHPELLYDLPLTSKLVEEYLNSLNLEVISGVGRSGVVGVIRNPGPCIMLRADMDCLPLQEANDVIYKSIYPNRMHACGHDAHTAMLLIAAKVLSRHKSELKGSVKFLFQPAEEGGHGAKEMRDDPKYPVLLSEPKVDEIYGIHVSNDHNLGDYLLADKHMSCFTDFFSIIITGKGGHLSAQTINPITIGSEIVLALQTIKSRNIPDWKRNVLSVTAFISGETVNAIPETCKLLGTIRSFEVAVRSDIVKRIQEICAGFEISNNCSIEVENTSLYGPIMNYEKCNEKALAVLEKISPIGKRDGVSPMIGEDFSYFTDVLPGNFFMLGCATPCKNSPIHSPTFDIDEHAMLIGSSFFVELILALLNPS